MLEFFSMPIIQSAIKKLRKDKKRTQQNLAKKAHLKEGLKKARKNPTPAVVKAAISAFDKAVKTNLIHRNKAARIKSRLAKLVKPQRKPATTMKGKTPQKRKSAKI